MSSPTTSIDVLSEVLAVCRSEHAVTARFALTEPWGLSSAGTLGTVIRLARGRGYWMQIGMQEPIHVEPGDFVMVQPGVPHRLYSGPDVVDTPFSELIKQHGIGPPGENPLVFELGGGGAFTDLYSAQLWFSAYCRHTVLRILPSCIHVREADLPLVNSLAATMQSLTEETLARRPGWRMSAARMGELMLVNLLREYLAKNAATGTGWLRGMADPAIARAIAQMHRAPQREWTVDLLAQEAALSRTRFNARFRELVGASPIGYLTAHRMALAAEALRAGGQALTRVAEDAGYESYKAFARAFRRWSGLSPGMYLRRENERVIELPTP